MAVLAVLELLVAGDLVLNRSPSAGGLCSNGHMAPTCMIHRTALIHQKRGEWQGYFLATGIGGRRSHLRGGVSLGHLDF